MEIGQLIKERRLELKLTLEDIGNAVGVGKSTVKKWEDGYIANMKRDKIAALANVLKLSPLLLMGCKNEPDSKLPSPTVTEDYTTFPVIGEVAAAYDHIAVEDWEGDTVDIPLSYLKGRKKEEFFVLRVKGDSMYPEYQDGDKVLILRQPALDYSGQVGVVLYDGDIGTLKKIEYVQGQNWMRLVPINPSFPQMKIEGFALEQCKVLGIPKLLIREITP